LKKLKIKFLKIFRYVKIGLVSTIIAALFFYYFLDPILNYTNDILFNASLLFLVSIDPLINGSRDADSTIILSLLLGVCLFSVIMVFIFYYLRFKLIDIKHLKPDPDDKTNNRFWIFKNVFLFKKRWLLLSLILVIFIIAVLSLQNLLFPAANNLRF
jgi:hypothetical protein